MNNYFKGGPRNAKPDIKKYFPLRFKLNINLVSLLIAHKHNEMRCSNNLKSQFRPNNLSSLGEYNDFFFF